jgi:chitinase
MDSINPAEAARADAGRSWRRRRTAVAAFATLALTTGGLLATAAGAQAAASTTGSLYVAPYVDMSDGQESMLNTALTSEGLPAYTAAFATGEGCSDIWGDTLPIGNDPTIGAEISTAKSDGAQVIISSGGEAGEPLSFTCTNQSTIDAGYQALINDYGTDYLDFDIEGAAIANTTGIDQTIQAMKDLKASNPGLVWSVTVPVTSTGLDNYGTALLQDAAKLGVTIPMVNIMTMDYYQGSIEMGQAAITAAEGTLSQMKAVNSSYTYANVGLTPMLGINDDGTTFTLADAGTVVSWAGQNGIGRLAFWSENRDVECPGGAPEVGADLCSGILQSSGAYTKAFTGGGSGGGTTPPPPGGGAIVNNNSSLCLSDSGDSSTLKTTGDIASCDSSAAQTWTAENGTLVDGNNLCLSVTGSSTALKAVTDVYTCNGSASENWTVNTNGTIVNTTSGLCLSVTGSATTTGATTDIYTCNGSASENWTTTS